jgi:glycosyltransferase involved in cell wall biosynthesis
VSSVLPSSTTSTTTRRHRRAAGAEVIEHRTNRGLGAAVRTGFAAAVARGASAVAFCDADGEYDPDELERLVGPVLDGRADYVVGSRFTGRIERMHPHRRLGNRTLTALVRFVVRQPVTDGQSGYRALSAAAATEVVVAHDYNYAQVLTIDLLARGFGYHEVPITYRFRSSGRSFVRLLPYLRRVVPVVRRQLAAVPAPVDHEPSRLSDGDRMTTVRST